MSTFDDLIHHRQPVEKSEDRYYTPPEAVAQFEAASKAPPRPGLQIVLGGLKRKLARRQEPARDEDGHIQLRTEKVITGRRPNFVDFVVSQTRDEILRTTDDYDRATPRDDDPETFAAWLAAEDEEAEKSAVGDVEVGDVILKSGTNLSAALRRGVAEAMRKAGL